MSTPWFAPHASTAGAGRPRPAGSDRGKRGATGRHHLGIVAGAATLLATAPLISLYEGWTWLFQSAFAIAAITAAATGARALRAPVWAQTLAMLGALLLAVTWQFRSGEELLLLPTPATLEHFGVLLGQVPNTIATEALPVGDREGLLLLTVIGVGLVAIMVDLAAVGMRRPALAGLPMLAIYSVPVAVRATSVPAFTFVIGVAGYLWLVATDSLDRVRRFGRRFTGDGRDVELWEPSPLAAAGRRLTVIGVLIAVALPLVIPGMTSGLVDRFGAGTGTGEGGGGSPTSVNLFATLDGLLNRNVTEDLLRLTTTDEDPYYLRIGVADQITERGFNHRAPEGEPVTGGIPDPADQQGVSYEQHHAEVEILSWNMNRLPTFAELTGISGLDDAWGYDPDQQVVFSGGTRAGGLGYEFDYARPVYDPDALRRADPLPDDHPIQREFAEVLPQPRVAELVDGVTEGERNPYDRVLAILRHFSRDNGFRYSLETGAETTGSAIVDFLLENQSGYCVQYAAGMAWMVREAGLPSRVAIGFTKGNQRTGSTYVLTNHNLHAWTEVYFNGLGWVPFDATPSASIAGSANPEWAPDPDALTGGNSNLPGGGQQGTPLPPGEGALEGPEFAPEPGGTGTGPLGSDGSTWRWWVLGSVAVLLALLTLPALYRVQLRRHRISRRPAAVTTPAPAAPGVVTSGQPHAAARQQAHAAWDELLDTMIDFRVALDPAETPRATTERLIRECRLGPDASDGTRLLGHAEERARYAATPLSPAGLVAALRTVRRAVASRASRRIRLRAVVLPPSTLLRWRTVVGDAGAQVATAASRLGDTLARLSPRRLLNSTR